MYHFCTYFDHNYLPRGLALYDSLQRHCPSFKLWVLCLSKECHDLLSQLELANIHLILLEDFEKDDEELWQAKQNRTRIEYYFTCTPSLPLYVFNNWPEVQMITYLDADLFFFSDPAPVFEEIGDHSIGIIGHRLPPQLKHLENWGIFNVGWVSFKRDENGLACLQWWRERCIEWCYDRYEDGRFADQKYLDDWPRRFHKVAIIQHKGAGLAPWNVDNYCIQTHKGNILIDDVLLIFFHFHNLKVINPFLYDACLEEYNSCLSSCITKNIYKSYIKKIHSLFFQRSGGFVNGIRWRDKTYSTREIVHLLIYRRILFVFGPFFAKVYLEPFARPLLLLRKLTTLT